MISFITWLWKQPGYRSQFTAQHVNVLAAMVRRQYPHPHTFKVVTDLTQGLDRCIEVVKPWNDFDSVPSPHGAHQPSCYRRLRAFHPEIEKTFGERFVSLDLDTVIVGDLTPLVDRLEDFVIWKEQDPRSFYNGSMFLLKAGARPQVWTKFNPKTSPEEAKAAGRFGSDQGFISHVLGKGEATWGREDGVYSYRVDLIPREGKLPKDARVVHCHGGHKPWERPMQKFPWVREHYVCQ